MTKQIITIFISDSGLRLMLTDGRQISDWSEISFNPGQIEGGVVNEEQQENVAAQIKQVLDFKSVSVRKVLIAISGIRCLTRPILLPKLPREILDEAVNREAERLLPVPLNELYITYQQISAPEGKTQVFLTAIPKRIIDPLIATFDKAGLKPVFMDVKPLLLARVAGEATSILLDVQKNDFDIVILSKGIPQPIRTVPFALENPSWSEKLVAIREELERTVTFYNSNNPDSPVDDSLPVQVSGIIDDEEEFCGALSEETGRTINMMSSPINTPEGFSFPKYMANIGLIVQEEMNGKKSGPSVVSLNTLPERYRPQPVSSLNILKLLGFAFAGLLVAGMMLLLQNVSSQVSAQKASLESTRSLLQQAQLESQIVTRQITNLESDIQAKESIRDNFASALLLMEARSIGLNCDIRVTMDSAPGSIRLYEVNHENNLLHIIGLAPNIKVIEAYILDLYETGRFTDIQYETAMQEDETHVFNLRGSLLIDTDWVSSVGVILGNLPSTVTLQFTATAERTLTLTGTSINENVLINYLDKLYVSGKFRSIDINEIRRIEDGTFVFNVELRMGE